MEGCNFQFIWHFEKCSFDVNMNCEFIFWGTSWNISYFNFCWFEHNESSIYVYLAFDTSKIFQYPTFLELVFSWTWKHEIKEMVVRWYVGILLIVKPSSSLLEHMVKLFTCTWIKNSCNGCGNIILVLTKCGKSSTNLLNVFLIS
jgi:hypothetical protein